MPAHLHLRDYLATGDFFGFDADTIRADVESLLGPPDYHGLVTRKHKLPRIWVYGGIALTFGYYPESPLQLIHFDHPNLPPTGSDSLAIDPWILAENMSLVMITDACRDAGIELTPDGSPTVPFWKTTGNVRLYFGDKSPDTGLAAVSRIFRD
ncbi:MAG: hypothetical protein ACE361_20540 [Aureliella sp.]